MCHLQEWFPQVIAMPKERMSKLSACNLPIFLLVLEGCNSIISRVPCIIITHSHGSDIYYTSTPHCVECRHRNTWNHTHIFVFRCVLNTKMCQFVHVFLCLHFLSAHMGVYPTQGESVTLSFTQLIPPSPAHEQLSQWTSQCSQMSSPYWVEVLKLVSCLE